MAKANLLCMYIIVYAPVDISTVIEFYLQLHQMPWEDGLEDNHSFVYYNMMNSVLRLVSNLCQNIVMSFTLGFKLNILMSW